jgi:DnaK suppressor protein
MTGMAEVAQARLLKRRAAIQLSLDRGQAAARTALAEELLETDAALQRIEQGSYGRCERCSGAIGRQRLLALPAARLCIECTGRARSDPGS